VKILFLNHNIIGRGTYWRCFHLARALVQGGHEVTLATVSDKVGIRPKQEDKQGVTLVQAPRLRRPGIHDGGWGLEDILWRTGWISTRRFDIVHAFAHRPSVALPWIFKRTLSRKGLFLADWDDWWTRGGIITPRRRFKFFDTAEAVLLEERLPRMARGLTVVSTVLRDRATRLGIPEEKILLLPQGADTESIKPRDEAECRQKLGLPRNCPVITFTGYAVWDVKILLEAFSLVRQKQPGCLLQIIGHDKDELMPRLIAVSGDKEAVLQQGQVPYSDLSTYLGASTVLVLPMQDRLDNRARWPIKLGDYLAAGRPVVM
jgi:glycosyltransferase involved in cell wall biosynthesis